MRRIPKLRLRLSREILVGAIALAILFTICGVAQLLRHDDQVVYAPIVVSAPKSRFNYNCNGGPQSLLCLEQQYKTITQKQGVPAAFVKLKADYAGNTNIQADCHQLAHVIGRTEADIAKNVDDAYAQGDNFCWSGYYHGVMESIVIKVGANNLSAKLPTICANIKAQKPYSFYHYNCVHGLGHGIMDVKDSNLPQSLVACDSLTDDWERQSCYGGAFMENEMDEVNPDHKATYFKHDDPMYPCTGVADKYQYQCYLMQTSHALRVANYDFGVVFAECSSANPKYVDVCYQSLGRDASGSSTSDVTKTKASCLIGSDFDAQSNCIIGAVKDFISYYHSDRQANDLCLALDPSLQQICQTTKIEYYKTF